MVDDGYSSQHSHKESDGHDPAQHRQQVPPRCEEADADAAVVLRAVQPVQSSDVTQEGCCLSCQEPAECCCQEQTQPALGGPLMEKVQATAECTAQRELALD